ncbi:hypothetical protein BDQ12DRAFT_683648 [Crucibulum laeve]|uniref:Uncharacterized protein n=1 Tax=Crucibulum laeve TaxID=68775 RepID=A0A5C3M256_9AGAR|nr:hypothetical protein BDQ12DRAFT_683648 [Crucibulum laeve]
MPLEELTERTGTNLDIHEQTNSNSNPSHKLKEIEEIEEYGITGVSHPKDIARRLVKRLGIRGIKDPRVYANMMYPETDKKAMKSKPLEAWQVHELVVNIEISTSIAVEADSGWKPYDSGEMNAGFNKKTSEGRSEIDAVLDENSEISPQEWGRLNKMMALVEEREKQQSAHKDSQEDATLVKTQIFHPLGSIITDSDSYHLNQRTEDELWMYEQPATYPNLCQPDCQSVKDSDIDSVLSSWFNQGDESQRGVANGDFLDLPADRPPFEQSDNHQEEEINFNEDLASDFFSPRPLSINLYSLQQSRRESFQSEFQSVSSDKRRYSNSSAERIFAQGTPKLFPAEVDPGHFPINQNNTETLNVVSFESEHSETIIQFPVLGGTFSTSHEKKKILGISQLMLKYESHHKSDLVRNQNQKPVSDLLYSFASAARADLCCDYTVPEDTSSRKAIWNYLFCM